MLPAFSLLATQPIMTRHAGANSSTCPQLIRLRSAVLESARRFAWSMEGFRTKLRKQNSRKRVDRSFVKELQVTAPVPTSHIVHIPEVAVSQCARSCSTPNPGMRAWRLRSTTKNQMSCSLKPEAKRQSLTGAFGGRPRSYLDSVLSGVVAFTLAGSFPVQMLRRNWY